jgi:hypothetical protein
MNFSGDWEIRWWHDALSEGTDIRQFANREWAQRWLLGFRGDLFRMAEFRRLLASANYRQLDRCNDNEVLNLLGNEIGSGRLLLVRRKLAYHSGGGGAKDQPAPPPLDAPAPPAARTPGPEPVADEPTFPAPADPVAIAAVLQEAASLGLPFCEECARKALARAAA